MKTADPGTIIEGTHNEEDLIEAFLEELRYLDGSAYETALAEYESIDPDSDDAMWYLNEYLFDLMDTYAPPGHYFGAHPDDGADFGYWEFEED